MEAMGLREMSYDNLGAAPSIRAHLADPQKSSLLARNEQRRESVAERVRSMSPVPNGRPDGTDEEYFSFIASQQVAVGRCDNRLPRSVHKERGRQLLHSQLPLYLARSS